MTLSMGDDGNDTLFADDGLFQQLYGDKGNDVLHGGAESIGTSVYGGDGDDTLYGESTTTFTFLSGGIGNDSLVGSAGLSYADYRDASGGVTVSLLITGSQDTGSAGIDTLSGIDGLIGSGIRRPSDWQWQQQCHGRRCRQRYARWWHR